MRSLTLLRHAKAVEATPGNDDRARPLTERGRLAAEKAGKLEDHAPPDVILCSSSRRTTETAEIAARYWKAKPPLILEDALYLASPAELRAQIAMLRDEFQRAWVVGHNPGLHQLAHELACRSDRPALAPGTLDHFPTACAAIFEGDAPNWGTLLRGPLKLIAWERPS